MNDPTVLLWVRALHIIFVVCWFAGIFYLPRIFVNHAMAVEESVRACLRGMERRLYRFITPLAALATLFGIWLLIAGWSYYLNMGWMIAKLALVVLLVVYHFWCGHYVKVFAKEQNVRSHVFFRWFNEVPVIVLFGSVILVEVRPF